MSCQTNANFCIDGNFKGLIAVFHAFKMLGLKSCYSGLLPRAAMTDLITAAQFLSIKSKSIIFSARKL